MTSQDYSLNYKINYLNLNNDQRYVLMRDQPYMLKNFAFVD